MLFEIQISEKIPGGKLSIKWHILANHISTILIAVSTTSKWSNLIEIYYVYSSKENI